MKKAILSLALALSLVLSLGQIAFAGDSNAFPRVAGKSVRYTIAADYVNGYAISNDGWLYAWGSNHEPTPVQFLNDVISVDGNNSNFFALKNDNTLWAWGITYDYKDFTPVQIMSDIEAVALASQSEIFVINSKGELRLWKQKESGATEGDSQLIVAEGAVRVFPSHEPLWFGDIVPEILAGEKAFIEMNDGTVRVWDYNDKSLKTADNPGAIIEAFADPHLDSKGNWYEFDDKSETGVTTTPTYTNIAAYADSGYDDFLFLDFSGNVSVTGRCGGSVKEGLVITNVRLPGAANDSAPVAEAPSTWAVEAVNKAIAANLVPASLQSKYTQATTRAEFCALGVSLYESVKGEITERATFSDTSDINVQKLASIGVVNGVGDNKFGPDNPLTREQAATMLSRLAEAIGKPLTQQAAAFNDKSSIASYALDAVGQMQATEVMGGVGNNTFAPKSPYTREQSIITIMRLYDIVK